MADGSPMLEPFLVLDYEGADLRSLKELLESFGDVLAHLGPTNAPEPRTATKSLGQQRATAQQKLLEAQRLRSQRDAEMPERKNLMQAQFE